MRPAVCVVTLSVSVCSPFSCSEPGQWDGSPLHPPLQRPSVGLREVRGPAGEDGEELPLSSRGEEAQVCGFPFTACRTVSPTPAHCSLSICTAAHVFMHTTKVDLDLARKLQG